MARSSENKQSNSERHVLLEAHPPRCFPLNLSGSRGEPPVHAKLRPISSEEYQVLVFDPSIGLPKPRRAQPAASRFAISSMLTLSLFIGLFIWHRSFFLHR